MGLDTLLPDLPAGRRADHERVATTPALRPLSAPSGPQLVRASPADLLAFVRAHRVCEASRALGLSERTVSRLSQGYWPADARAVMRAWVAYRGQAAPASRWFLRLVRTGGLVRHGRSLYTGHNLAVRDGQLVAVARAAGGGLLAQTLELPITRLPLAPAPTPAPGLRA